MEHYLLTLLSSAFILIASFVAIRYRKVSAYVRLATLALSALFLLCLFVIYGDTTQLYGLGILAVASVFPLILIYVRKKQTIRRANR